MDNSIERDLGPQPIADVMQTHGLRAHDVVAASGEQVTHKMVSRARKGRRLSRRVQFKLMRALNAATGRGYTLEELFTY